MAPHLKKDKSNISDPHHLPVIHCHYPRYQAVSVSKVDCGIILFHKEVLSKV
jgi:hypothetical protein